MSKATGDVRPLRIAVASGKGGTGKTTVAVAMALVHEGRTLLLDCDVEEPNAGLFLKKEETGAKVSEGTVTVPIPVVDEGRCAGCGLCAKACRFNAIIVIKKDVTIFPDLCHSCGACSLSCPEGAIREEPASIGRLREWDAGRLRFIQAEMDVGRAMSPPLIRAVKKRGTARAAETDGEGALTIVDCPPGTSCAMVTAVRDSDFVLLVTEPTPFGLHDLTLAVATMRTVGLPFGVVVNRYGVGDDRVEAYCEAEGIPVLARIPNDRRIAEAYSSGGSLLSAAASDSHYRLVRKLIADVERLAKGVAA